MMYGQPRMRLGDLKRTDSEGAKAALLAFGGGTPCPFETEDGATVKVFIDRDGEEHTLITEENWDSLMTAVIQYGTKYAVELIDDFSVSRRH